MIQHFAGGMMGAAALWAILTSARKANAEGVTSGVAILLIFGLFAAGASAMALA